MKHLYTLIIASAICLFSISKSHAQCNTGTSICNPGTAGPFTFVNPGPPVSTCLDWIGPNIGYIMLYITQSGPLNMLIDGNSGTGFLDVAVFNIPTGQSPCTAIQNTSNQIGCNYASNSSGCNQFGNAFPCPSSVPAPYVTAGQVLMIVVENWSGASSNFTLQLGPAPGAQTGPPNASINPVSNTPCVNSAPFQLTAVNMGGTWSGPGVSASGMFNPATAGAGTHTITYNLGTAPCNASSTTTVTVNPLPVISASAPTTICSGQPTILTASGGTTYNWSGGAGTGNSVTVSPTSTTTYTVTGTVSGCSATATTTVNVIPFLTLNVNSPTICYGDSVLLIVDGAEDYNWSNGDAGDSIYVSPQYQTDYTVIGSDSYGCSGTTTSTVYVNPLPQLEVTSPFTCPGIPVAITVSGADSYLWPSTMETTASITVPGMAGSYLVVGTTDGCVDSAMATVTSIAVPELNITSDVQTGCVPLAVTFSADDTGYPFTGYAWEFGDGGQSSMSDPTHVYNTLGCQDVSVTATYAAGCIVSDTIECMIEVFPLPEAAFVIQPGQVITTPDATFTNLSTGSDAWIWNFGDGNTGNTDHSPSHSYGASGTYDITLVALNSQLGCSDTVTHSLVVNSEVSVFIPNSFTPNEDGLNDFFIIRGKGLVEASLVIFDRWGQPLVRLDKDQPMMTGWDGKFGGGFVKQDVYVYKVSILDVRGETHEFMGNINVVY